MGKSRIFVKNYSKLNFNGCKIIGNFNKITGNDNFVTGNFNKVFGNDNIIVGNFNKTYGENNTCQGNFNARNDTIKKVITPKPSECPIPCIFDGPINPNNISIGNNGKNTVFLAKKENTSNEKGENLDDKLGCNSVKSNVSENKEIIDVSDDSDDSGDSDDFNELFCSSMGNSDGKPVKFIVSIDPSCFAMNQLLEDENVIILKIPFGFKLKKETPSIYKGIQSSGNRKRIKIRANNKLYIYESK